MTLSTQRVGAWVLLATIVGSSMASIDGTAVNVALPALSRDLHADSASLQWVVEGYALFLSALILLGGALGDRFGRRLIFLIGIAIFALASLVCGLAPNIEALIAARCLQGIGGALATPGSLALIAANFSGEERGKAIGTWSGFSAIMAAIGPVLGGWLSQTFSWRWVFFINLPLAAFVIAASLYRVPESQDKADTGRVDIGGAALATLSLGALTYGLIRLQAGSGDAIGIGCAVVGMLLLVAFLYVERREKSPMMPLDVFADRTFSGANLYTLFLYAALGGSLFFVPFNLQNVQGYSPLASGAALLPFIAIMFLSSRWSGGLVARIGARTPLFLGALIAGAGLVAYAFTGVGRSYWVSFFPAAVIFGVGGALFVAPLTTTVMNAVKGERSGVASGINNAISRVAGLLAIAVLGIVLVSSFYRSADRRISAAHLSSATTSALAADRGRLPALEVPKSIAGNERQKITALLRSAYATGFRNAMLAGAFMCIIAAVIAWFTIDSRPVKNAAPS